VRRVNQAVKLRVLPDDEEETALEQTLRTCNAAASWLSTQMHTARVFRKIDARHRFYTELRQRFGLGAQAANRVIGKVAGANAALHANITAGNYGPPRRRHVEESSIVFRPLGGAAVRFTMFVVAIPR
jgi:putative transposase